MVMAKKTTTKTSKTKKNDLSEEQIFEFIKDRAMRLWHDSGEPEGNDWDLWFKAEAEVRKQIDKLKK